MNSSSSSSDFRPSRSPSESSLDPFDLSLEAESFDVRQQVSSPLLEKVRSSSAPKKMFESRGRFAQRQKSEYISTLTAALTRKQGEKAAPAEIQGKLSQLSMDELEAFEHAFNNGLSPKLLLQDPQLAAQSFSRAESFLPRFSQVLGEEAPFRQLLNALASCFCTQPSGEVEEFCTDLTSWLKQAYSLQSKTFVIMDQHTNESIHNFVMMAAKLGVSAASWENSCLIGIINTIQDQTVMTNDKGLEEAIEGIAGSETHLGRTAIHFSPRVKLAEWSLYEEQHPGELVVENGMVDFDRHPAEVDIVLTKPHTYETRTVRMHLPLSGQVSLEEAQQLCREMGQQARTITYNDQTPLAESLKAAKLTMAKAVSNLARPRRSPFTVQEPELVEFFANPKDLRACCRACALGHVFPLETGNFSLLLPDLLPEGVEVPSAVCQMTPSELKQASAVLRAGGGELTIQAPTVKNNKVVMSPSVPMKIEAKREVRNGNPYLNVTLSIGGAKRLTSYPLYTQDGKKEVSVEDKLKTVAESPLFKRDVLLAKSKYLEFLTT